MIVINKKACVLQCGPACFLVGSNQVTDQAVVAYLTGDSGFKRLIEGGALEVVSVDAQPVVVAELPKAVEAADLSKLTDAAAIKVAKQTLDRKTLMNLLEVETRPPVRAALEAQLKKMNEPDKRPEGK